jgi:transposase
VENAVLLVERWILARLRHQSFFSLTELNAAIRELLEVLNRRPFARLPPPALRAARPPGDEALARRALPYAEWKRARVHIDYHVEVEGHYYSVPYPLVKQELEVRLSAHTVECFYQGKRVASHRRSYHKGRHTTLPEHMPKAHQHYAGWSPQRLVGWAEKTGPATAELVATILASRAHPQQGYRSCLGIMRLGKHYGEQRLEAASRRALAIGAMSFKSLESILKHGLDAQAPLNTETRAAEPLLHPNLRGAQYYH